MKFVERAFGSPKRELPKEETEKRKNPLSSAEEEILEMREKASSKDIIGGCSSRPVFVEFKDDGAGIFKLSSREEKLEHVGNYKKERAAYLADRFLGFGLVPPTVIREIDGEIGSVQEFVPDAKTAAEAYLTPAEGKEPTLTKEQKQSLKSELFKLWFFDYLLYNRDRHGGNLLVKENKIYAIDNGWTFRKNDFYWPFCRFFDTPIPQEVKDAFERFYSWKEGKEILRDLLLELLDKDEVDCFFKRVEVVERFVRQGTIPENAQSALKFDPGIIEK